MSLLSIIRDAADGAKATRPTQVIGSGDLTARLMLRCANESGKTLALRHDWEAMQREASFTATATTVQSDALPSDFSRTMPGTFWNRTQNRRIVGPLSSQRWQQLQSGLIVMPYDAFRIRGGSLLMTPTPTAGDQMYYEYVSKYWCMSSGDTTADQESWADDTDVSVFDEELMTLDVIWRYQKANGLDYGESMNSFEFRLASLTGTDGGIADLDMGNTPVEGLSDPYINDGNWNIS